MIRLALFSLAALAAGLQGCAPLIVGGAVAGGAMVAVDRRPPDIMASDERIELQATDRINGLFKDKGHINVTSFNRQVLLTGEAPTEALKQEAERAAATTPEVKSVVNELVIGPRASSARAPTTRTSPAS